MAENLFSFIVGAAMSGVLFVFVGIGIGEDATMAQAYNRGYAVECLGVTGYHWECEENR